LDPKLILSDLDPWDQIIISILTDPDPWIILNEVWAPRAVSDQVVVG